MIIKAFLVFLFLFTVAPGQDPQNKPTETQAIQVQVSLVKPTDTKARVIKASVPKPIRTHTTQVQASQTEHTDTQAPQVQSSEAQPTNTHTTQVQASQTKHTHTQAPQVQSSEAQPTNTHTTQVQASQTKHTHTQAPQVQASQTKNTHTQAPQVQASQTRPTHTQAPQIQASRARHTHTQTTQVQASQAKPTHTQAPLVQAPWAQALQNFVKQNFHSDIESDLNDQINKEYQAFYYYDSRAALFERPDVGLLGFQKFFKKAAHEEREHAREKIEYMNKRGGEYKPKPINDPGLDVINDDLALDTVKSALELEKEVNQKLIDLHNKAGDYKDPNIHKFLDGFLMEQVEFIAELGILQTRLEIMSDKKLAVFLIDQELRKKKCD